MSLRDLTAPILTLSLISLACGSEPHSDSPSEHSRQSPSRVSAAEILAQAAAALRAVETVRYDFEYGGPDDPTGWLRGTTWMRRRSDLADSWIRVEGTVLAQPELDVSETSFAYATDGEQAWAREGDSVLETAPVGAGANRLSARAVYGYLPEFVEAEPLWRERSLATEVELLEPTMVDGEPCDVVRVAIELDRGETSEIVWTIARIDRLPRRGRWMADFTAPAGMILTLTDLRTGLELPRSFFASPAEPDDAERVTTVGVGEVVPAWTLPRPDGGSVSSDELSRQVVVLDFWNTWCPICRSIAPATHELARRLEDRGVRFFGVNIFETGDPVAYWEETAPPYPMLLEGEELGRRLDLPWQPGIAVIGPDGVLLYKQLGASADRLERVLEAVENGLSQHSEASAVSK